MENKYLSSMLTIFSILTFLMLSVNMASASIENLGTFKTGSCINLLQTCSDCTYNNISSVTYPDGTQALGQVAMEKIGTQFNYTFCDTAHIGRHNVNGYGDPTGVKTIFVYYFDVTASGGFENNTTFFIIIIVIAVGLLLLGFIFENYIFAFFGGLTFLIAGVYGMIYGYGSVTNLYTQMISYILIGLGAIITIVSGLDLMGFTYGTKNTGEDDD